MKKLLIVVALVLAPVILWGQESNPDGNVGQPSFTLLGGLGTGGIKEYVGGADLYDFNLKDYGFRLEIVYPMAKSVSFIFQANVDKQNQTLPETSGYFKVEDKSTSYGIVFGIRLFSHSKK